MITATYSPEDDKIRLYSEARLSQETYSVVSAAGFSWAPKQGLFYAVWSPAREDLAIELAGEIGDEDTSLIERAEERADRFEEYSDKRESEADRAKASIDAIADNIPIGQPILVGHHSERHARKDAERIRNGMRKAVKLWETSQYWIRRAQGAIAHAKYKELPGVRHRRIKTLEAEIRRLQASYTPCEPRHEIMQTRWDADGVRSEIPEPHVWCAPKGSRGGSWVPVASLPAIEASCRRWIEHIENRIAYEKAMLDEAGGIAAEKFDIQPGGQVLIRGEWVTVVRVNKGIGGEVVSVTTNTRYCKVRGIETVRDYRPATEETSEKVKAATKLPPLCNYPGEGFTSIEQAKWNRTHKDYKGTSVVEAKDGIGRHRVRVMMSGGYGLKTVFITDAPTKTPPKDDQAPAIKLSDLPKEKIIPEQPYRRHEPTDKEKEFQSMAEAARNGVKVVVTDQLFPTPKPIVHRLIHLAELSPGMEVLEPSAGTGNIVRELTAAGCKVWAVEVNQSLSDMLSKANICHQARQGNFLEMLPEDYGTFDRIVMNPPFSRGEDIEHVQHALRFLRDGGRLVSVVANGPRQQEALQPIATAWIELPADSFKDQGTRVNTAIVVIDKD